jgi:hypothetical protein
MASSKRAYGPFSAITESYDAKFRLTSRKSDQNVYIQVRTLPVVKEQVQQVRSNFGGIRSRTMLSTRPPENKCASADQYSTVPGRREVRVQFGHGLSCDLFISAQISIASLLATTTADGLGHPMVVIWFPEYQKQIKLSSDDAKSTELQRLQELFMCPSPAKKQQQQAQTANGIGVENQQLGLPMFSQRENPYQHKNNLEECPLRSEALCVGQINECLQDNSMFLVDSDHDKENVSDHNRSRGQSAAELEHSGYTPLCKRNKNQFLSQDDFQIHEINGLHEKRFAFARKLEFFEVDEASRPLVPTQLRLSERETTSLCLNKAIVIHEEERTRAGNCRFKGVSDRGLPSTSIRNLELDFQFVKEYEYSEQQQRAIHACISENRSIFITGGGGTGKSVLLKKIIDLAVDKIGSAGVFVTATTGLAACAIGQFIIC